MLLGWNKLENAEFRKQVGRELHFWYFLYVGNDPNDSKKRTSEWLKKFKPIHQTTKTPTDDLTKKSNKSTTMAGKPICYNQQHIGNDLKPPTVLLPGTGI